MALIARLALKEEWKDPARSEWIRLLKGIKNNQPEFLNEWMDVSANNRRRALRSIFGENRGNQIRQAGWHLINIGPLTQAAAQRFGVKLGKALYYRHLGELFEGDIYVRILDPFIRVKNPTLLQELLRDAPGLETPQRNNKPLSERFSYRFNYGAEIGAVYAFVQIGSQLLFSVLALRKDTAEETAKDAAAQLGERYSTTGVFRCTLRRE